MKTGYRNRSQFIWSFLNKYEHDLAGIDSILDKKELQKCSRSG
jgi:hypothetical protein